MMSRRALSLISLVSVVAACGGGGGDGFVTPTPPPAVTVSMAPATASVLVGASTSFAVSIAGGSPTPTLQSCSSSAPAIATATQNGTNCVATGVTPGNATITATTSGAQTATAQVSVSPGPPALTAFTLQPPTTSLAVGSTLALTTTVTNPPTATVAISFTSNAVSVATVSAAGVVTAVAPGTATITAVASGSGPGLNPVSITLGATITVTASACAPTVVTLPVNRNGTVSSASCLLTATGPQRGDVFRVNLAQQSALELRVTPTGFAPYLSAINTTVDEFIFFTGQTSTEVRRTWLMPPVVTEMRVGAAVGGQSGSYVFTASAVSSSVENCANIIIGGTLQTNQSLTATDCNLSGFFTDQFLVYSPRPCVVTMARVTSGGGMVDPFLEVFDGASRVAFDDDGAGGVNARISLSSCRSASDGVLVFQASSFDAGDTGTYIISFQFGSPAVADAALDLVAMHPAKGMRASSGGAATSGTWLDQIGVGTRGLVPQH